MKYEDQMFIYLLHSKLAGQIGDRFLIVGPELFTFRSFRYSGAVRPREYHGLHTRRVTIWTKIRHAKLAPIWTTVAFWEVYTPEQNPK